MTTQTTIIPRDITGMNKYLNLTYAYLLLSTLTGNPAVLVVNWTRYKWTSTNLADWLAFLTLWNPLYLQYIDKKGTYTTDGKLELEKLIVQIIEYAKKNKLIELIRATIDLTAKDCSTFHLPATLATGTGTGTHVVHTTPATDRTVPTAEMVYPKLIPGGGGVVRCKCFQEITESGRPHKLKDFDTIEYMFGVFYSGTANLPTSAKDPRLAKGHTTKASFLLSTIDVVVNLPVLPAGTVPPAKVLVICFRNAKSKHENLDGPWSVIFITVLL